MKTFQIFVSILFFSAILACGGGGSDSNTGSTNIAPTISVDDDLTVVEGDLVSLSSTATDIDGTIASIIWNQISGPLVDLDSQQLSNANIQFDVPWVINESQLVFQVTATDNDGRSVSDQAQITIGNRDLVVFTGNKDQQGYAELFVNDSSGNNQPNKLSGELVPGGNVFTYSTSPTGQFVAFTADKETDGLFELFVVPTTGGSPQKLNGPLLPESDVLRMIWSPNGTSVAYIADTEVDNVYHLYMAEIPSGQSTRLSLNSTSIDLDVKSVKWSPNSRYIAYLIDDIIDEQFNLKVIDLDDNNNVIQLNPDLEVNQFITTNIKWASDSSRIAYLSNLASTELADLFSVMPNGSEHSKVNGLLIANAQVMDFKWAPDASHIAYRANQDVFTLTELYRSRPDGTENLKLNDSTLGAIQPNYEWSSDSQSIALMAQVINSQTNELFVNYFDGMPNTRLNGPLVTGGAVFEFVWSPDASRIAYIADETIDEIRDVYFINSDGTEQTKINSQLPSTDKTSGLKWSSDSSKFLYQRFHIIFPFEREVYYVNVSNNEPRKINNSLISGGSVIDYQWGTSSDQLYYRANQNSLESVELYAFDFNLFQAVNISGQMVSGSNIHSFQVK